MTLLEIASHYANLNTMVWGSIFFIVYFIFFIKFRKEIFIALLYSGVTIIGYFTLLNIIVAHNTIFGGPGDIINSITAVNPIIYLVQVLFLFITGYLSWQKHIIKYFWSLLHLIIIIFLALFFQKIVVPGSLLLWLIFVVVAEKITADIYNRYHEKIYVIVFKKYPKVHKTVAMTIWIWSLVWVGSYLFRAREMVFDCEFRPIVNSEISKLGQDKDAPYGANTQTLFSDITKTVGEPLNKAINYSTPRYSLPGKNDITYFYCPIPYFPIQHETCEGFRISTDSSGIIRNTQKRGLLCEYLEKGYFIYSLTKDPVYYFFWSADMWSLKLIPSEHYVMSERGVPMLLRYIL